jgi:hypothetical protein
LLLADNVPFLGPLEKLMPLREFLHEVSLFQLQGDGEPLEKTHPEAVDPPKSAKCNSPPRNDVF